MVNISIYPYGNANEKQSGGQWVFTCQHGANECAGNLVETCGIFLTGWDQTKFMSFTLDFEKQFSRNSRDAFGLAQTMLETGDYPITWTQMNGCITGSSGNTWEHDMALWTQQARHTYTPWITLNGKHSNSIQNSCSSNTLKCTCDLYTGTNSCCSRLKKEEEDQRCYPDGRK